MNKYIYIYKIYKERKREKNFFLKSKNSRKSINK